MRERWRLALSLALWGGFVRECSGVLQLSSRPLPDIRQRIWGVRGGARRRPSYQGDDDDDYEEEYGAYPSYRQPPPTYTRRRSPIGPRSRQGFESLISQPMPPALRNTGFYMLLASAVLTAVGVSLFFERNILRLSNLCLVLGLPLYLGPSRVLRLVFAKEKMRATACFLLGVILVLRGNSFVGTLIEAFGFLNLFANLFPLLLAVVRQMPVVGDFLRRPEPSYARERPPPYRRRDEGW